MCTLTWWRGDEGEFEVFFNRDEKKTRSRAELPLKREENGMQFLSPRDPDGGGTWMLVNEDGVVLCLLNRWHEESKEAVEWESRGRLVWDLAGVHSVEEVWRVLEEMNLRNRKPFSLWAFDAKTSLGMDWSTGKLSIAAEEMPITSSSYCYEEIVQSRKACFAEMGPSDVDSLERFQGSEGVESSAETVRMCRPDAQTMSRSRVRVKGGEIWWEYLEEADDLSAPPARTVTSLKRA